MSSRAQKNRADFEGPFSAAILQLSAHVTKILTAIHKSHPASSGARKGAQICAFKAIHQDILNLARIVQIALNALMSIAQIKEEAKALSDQERRSLVAYLVHLEESANSDFIDDITEKIDDRDNFKRWEEIRGEFSED